MKIKVEDRQFYIERAEDIIKRIDEFREENDTKVEQAFNKWYAKKWFKPKYDKPTTAWAWDYLSVFYPSESSEHQYDAMIRLIRVLKTNNKETVYLDDKDIRWLQL